MKYVYTGLLFFLLSFSGIASVSVNNETMIDREDNNTDAVITVDPVTINVFPNPATSYIDVTCEEEIDEIVIFNTLGAVVYREKGNGTTSRISISDLPKGVYLLRCNGSTKRFVKK
jgi:hypothetical protein